MKTDSIFYQIFQQLPNIFFELIGEPSAEANAYRFESVEIKETKKRIDGVFLPVLEDNHPIYFAEVQFQYDKDFYYRLITETFLYLGQNKPKKPWCAVAVFSRPGIEPEVPIEYEFMVPSQQVRCLYLNQLGEAASQSVGLGMVKLVVEDETVALEQARQLIEQAQQQLEDEALRRKVLELIETILIYKFTSKSRQEIEAMFGLSDLKKTRVYQEGKEEGRLVGRLEGRLEGKEEGKEEVRLETVPLLLKLGLSVERVAEELKLDVEVVRQIAQRQSDN